MVDHSFDHLASRTTWKQCEREHPKASFSDSKVLKSLVNQGNNRCRFVWAVDAAGSNPVTPTKPDSFERRVFEIAVLTATKAAGEALWLFYLRKE